MLRVEAGSERLYFECNDHITAEAPRVPTREQAPFSTVHAPTPWWMY